MPVGATHPLHKDDFFLWELWLFFLIMPHLDIYLHRCLLMCTELGELAVGAKNEKVCFSTTRTLLHCCITLPSQELIGGEKAQDCCFMFSSHFYSLYLDIMHAKVAFSSEVIIFFLDDRDYYYHIYICNLNKTQESSLTIM